MVYTDKEKNDIAWQEYSKLNVGKDVLIGKGKQERRIGYVSEILGQPPEKDMVTSPQDLEVHLLKTKLRKQMQHC